LRVLELTEQVVAALLVATRQGVRLRQQIDPTVVLQGNAAKMYDELEERIPLIEEDRALDTELRSLIDAIRQQAWTLYEDTSTI
jgi:histidine ammonia-lyase